MGTEIERKFLVADDSWRTVATSSSRIRQGYLCVDPSRTVRVRIAGDRAWLTIKGASHGAVRSEYEYALPVTDAQAMLDRLCRPGQVDKTRHLVPHGALTFEVDEFHGDNAGLVLAEIELDAADTHVDLPAWIASEVTGDPRYFNAHLVQHPFRTWPAQGD